MISGKKDMPKLAMDTQIRVKEILCIKKKLKKITKQKAYYNKREIFNILFMNLCDTKEKNIDRINARIAIPHVELNNLTKMAIIGKFII